MPKHVIFIMVRGEVSILFLKWFQVGWSVGACVKGRTKSGYAPNVEDFPFSVHHCCLVSLNQELT